MRFAIVPLFLCVSLLCAQIQPSQPCEASAEVQKELKRLDIPPEIQGAKRQAIQNPILKELVTRYPDDLFVQMRALHIERSRPHSDEHAIAERYTELAAAHPGSERYALLKALALMDVHTLEAADILKAQKSNPWAHFTLSDVYAQGKFKDKSVAQKELGVFFDFCPASWDKTVWNRVNLVADPPFAATYASKFRQQLEADTNPDHFEQWETVWNLEFKAHPPAEHEPIRKQVAADMARLKRLHTGAEDAKWLWLLGKAYKMAGNQTNAHETEEAILKRFPASDEADRIEGERWNKAHPWPGETASDEDRKSFNEAYLKQADEKLARKPGDTDALFDRLQALEDLDSATIEQVDAAAGALIEASKTNQDFEIDPPLEFFIAQVYVKKKTRVDQVPALVETGWKVHQEKRRSKSDRDTDEWTKMMAESETYMKQQRADILLDAAKQLGKPEIARAAYEEFMASTPKPKDAKSVWSIGAKWAELDGRKLDALLFYRALLDARPASFKPPKNDELADNVARLRKELGGTDASNELWANKTAGAAVAEEGRWEKPDKEMTSWELSDLQGKTWKLTSLEGKRLLINLWATWCGPCRAEQPHLEKLYQTLKDRSDIQILTFNVDDEVGLVEPYMKENGYHFPVLLAADYVRQMLNAISIPRNWIVDAHSKWRWEQIGFGSEQGWEEAMIEKLDSVR